MSIHEHARQAQFGVVLQYLSVLSFVIYLDFR
jgi:hypothetical protein